MFVLESNEGDGVKLFEVNVAKVATLLVEIVKVCVAVPSKYPVTAACVATTVQVPAAMNVTVELEMLHFEASVVDNVIDPEDPPAEVVTV